MAIGFEESAQQRKVANMEFMFAKDLEQEFRLPESTWRYWHLTGKLPATKLGRRVVWRREDVLTFLAAQGLLADDDDRLAGRARP
jgi:hypothetical protein